MKPKLSLFSTEELEIINKWIRVFSSPTAKSLVSWSHKFECWKHVEEGDFIPYHAIFWDDVQNQAPISDKDKIYAKRFFEKRNGGLLPPAAS